MEGYITELRQLDAKLTSKPYIFYYEDGRFAALCHDITVGRNLLLLGNLLEERGKETVLKMISERLSVEKISVDAGMVHGAPLSQILINPTQFDIWTIARLDKALR